MTKWIRWWGLGAFLLVVAVIASLWVFFVDGWVKGLIEDVGTDVVAAKVDLDHADVSLFPVGLTLTRLQVTNPKAPMTNAVEVGRIAMGLDGLNLLQRKVIVEEMSVEGVRMGTSRTTSGAVKPVREPATEENGMFAISLPSLEVPDVNTILQNEDLETMRLIEELKADLKQEKATWESRLQNLPGKGHVAKYQERVKQLKTATKGGLEGILGGVGEVQSLKEEIDRDLQSLKDAQKEFDEKVALLKRRLEQIKTAPQRDIQHLQTKYNLSPQGLANLSQTLLGSQIGSWVHQGVAWYERAKPFLEGAQAMGASQAGPEVQKPLRGKGVDVHFTEEQPLPDFLVRLARVSLNLDVGNLDGTIHNVTSDQPRLGKPLTFAFAGDQLKGVNAVALEGTLNHIVPAQSRDQLTLKAKGYELDDVTLSKDAKWPVTLKRGLGDITMETTLEGPSLSAQGSGHLHTLQLAAGVSGDTNPLTKSLSSAVSGISQLSLTANVTGTLDNYDVKLSSDLDRILQDAAGKMVNELAAKFGGELKAAISAKIAEPMKELQDTLGGFNAIGGDLGDRVGQHTEVLNSLLEKSLPSKSLKKLPGGLKLPF